MAENVGNTRLTAYKNHSKNNQEMRQRRHEVTVELRKSKKDDQMLKRRNIEANEPLSPLHESNAQSPVPVLTEEQIIEGMSDSNVETQFAVMQAVRKMLSREKNPPIDVMISYGIIPICVSFLARFDEPKLQFEAAWALTNVASGSFEQTQAVINANGVMAFVALLRSPVMNVAEQAVWALGNISGDGPVARDKVLSHNVVEGLLHLMKEDTPMSFVRNAVWLMSNLCRNKNPPPPFEKVCPLLPVLAKLLHHSDIQVIVDACWAISYITDDENLKIQSVIDAGCLPRLVELLDIDVPSVITPALRSVGNIVTGTDVQTDLAISCGVLNRLSKLLMHTKSAIVKEAAWAVSNVTAGNCSQIQQVIDAGLFNQVIHVLKNGDYKAQKEATWIVTNATAGGAPEQIVHILENYQILKPFCDLLSSVDVRTLIIVLSGITNLFQLTDKMGGQESLCVLMEEVGVVDKLEALQSHQNEEIYRKAYSLVDTYFSAPETDDPEIGSHIVDGALTFNSNTNNTPQGGFNF